MNFIKSKDSQGKETKIFYQDVGEGKPVVLIHGWPLSHEMWEYQLNELPKYGIRCIAYDRRGFGRSDQPWGPYDYTTLATDLKALLDVLDLHDVTLVGFSMGGGEVVRYLSKFKADNRVSKAVLISSVTPYLLKTDDNPNGVPKEQIDEFVGEIEKDRPAFLSAFGKQFYGVSWISHPVSDDVLNWTQSLALKGSGKATIDTMRAWSETDFRDEMPSITVPVLIIHGSKDDTVPIEVTSKEDAKMLPNAEFLVYEGAPHGLFYIEKDKLNNDLKKFIIA